MKIREIKTAGFTWLDIEKPTREKLAVLGKKYNFHHLDIEDVLTYTQRPKVEKYDHYLFMIVRYPIFDKNERRFNLSEIDLFVGRDFFISIHRGNIAAVTEFIEECRSGSGETMEKHTADPAFLLYYLLKNIFLSYFPIIDHLSDDLDAVEDIIFCGRERELVRKIMMIKRNIITMRRTIGPHRLLMKNLENIDNLFPKSMTIYFSDVADFVEKIWAVSESHYETVTYLESTNETLISNKSNEIVKILTIFSATILPLTLIASIYGMNVSTLPFNEHPSAFWIIIVIMLLTGIVLSFFFRRKKWL